MILAIINFISRKLSRLESRFGLVLSSAIVATLLMACAMLYVQPSFEVVYHGILFSDLSKHPFDFSKENHLHYRIFTPLLGYILFLRGENFFILPLIASWFFIANVYYQYRRKNFLPVDSFILSCFITFSCVVLIPLIAPGYTDVITYIFIFLAFIHAEKIILSALFFSLALLNHESSIILLPALALYAYEHNNRNNKVVAKIFLFFFLACIPHLCWRWCVNANPDTLYSLSFYFSKKNIFFSLKPLVGFLPVATFYTFKLWWIVPVSFTCWAVYSKKYLQAVIILSILAGSFSLLIISYDYTRMLVISFPAVLLSYKWMMESFDREKLRKLTMVLIALNFLILQYQFDYYGAHPMFPWILNKVSAVLGTPLR